MAAIEQKCCICEATFQPGVLNKAGKCPSCEVAHPTAKTRKDAMAKSHPEFHMGNELTVDKVREIVREELGKTQNCSLEAKGTPDTSAAKEYAKFLKNTAKPNKNKETK